ncbi:hypothetical protein [Flavobacterium sp.]|uniref:hypothetical protein n=1 Tax=Flavobacterium sp. TaxID=239 RepID=UPI003F69A892
MNKLLFILILMLSSSNYAQELKYEDGKFYQNGRKISKNEIREKLETYNKSIELYLKAKDKGTTGGFLLGFGIGLIATDLTLGLTQYNYEYPKASTFIGLGAIAISIPVLSGRKKMIQKSLDLYTEYRKEMNMDSGYNYNVDFVTNHNGIGLKIQF